MPIIVVEVMPKAELLDPQGKAVAGALARSGSTFSGVRIGKRFELSFDGEADDAALGEARELADSMLSNSVIEDVVSVHYGAASGGSWQAYSPLGSSGAPVGSASASSTSSTTVFRGEFADEPAGAASASASTPSSASSTAVLRGEFADEPKGDA